MDANLNLIRGFSFFSIRPILRITPIRSPFCQLTNTRVKQDGIKKMGDRGVEGEHRGGSELTQVRYADAIDGWSTSKRLVVSFQWLMKRASCACTHAHSRTQDRRGGGERKRRHGMIISRCRHVATGLTDLSVPRFTSTLLIKLRGLQINLSLITRPVPIQRERERETSCPPP